MNTIKIGTRPSKLAIAQVKEISQLIHNTSFEIITIHTKGDKDKITPLAKFEKTNFFTYEIEQALLNGSIDAAIHSAKDLEENPPAELTIAAVTHSISPFECLASRNGLKLNQLPANAVIGTSSKKRAQALKRFRKDLIVKSIRGDIDQRLQQLDNKKFDAIIIAHAALLRLAYEYRISEIIPDHIIKPHPAQGKLAVQVKRDNLKIIEVFKRINEK